MGIGVKICELGGSLAEWNKCEFWGRTDLCVHPPLSCVALGTWGGLSELGGRNGKPTPVLPPGKFRGQSRLMGYSL